MEKFCPRSDQTILLSLDLIVFLYLEEGHDLEGWDGHYNLAIFHDHQMSNSNDLSILKNQLLEPQAPLFYWFVESSLHIVLHSLQ